MSKEYLELGETVNVKDGQGNEIAVPVEVESNPLSPSQFSSHTEGQYSNIFSLGPFSSLSEFGDRYYYASFYDFPYHTNEIELDNRIVAPLSSHEWLHKQCFSLFYNCMERSALVNVPSHTWMQRYGSSGSRCWFVEKVG